MKSMLPFGLVLALALSVVNTAVAADLPAHKVEQFRAFLHEFRIENKIPSLSVAIVKDDEIAMRADNGFVVRPVKCDESITLRQVLQNQVQGELGIGFFITPLYSGASRTGSKKIPIRAGRTGCASTLSSRHN
ncbi:hypothetical protein [Pseudidiomarina insulisalsae]|uniref:Beta-lactamase-related domain-containing protein n=1 Tax=Pseudidiomarina insulisalsae TaxID=575789 RepID=A0A432YQK7_9GAMM|nr:hypothetical protein [Pseudidiomarina insulisalsae]RUO63556.1 hypothetical protein CWI71_00390 [Pseudidiomarina insulisalsae]